jgi:orotidine-5'-phosphate decarboxylase
MNNFLGTPRTHIMLALDTENREDAFAVLERCADSVDTIKFNYPLILSEGLSIITDIKERFGLPIVADFKVADVPVTNNRIVDLVKKAGADAIMVHGFIGANGLDEICDRAGDELGVIIVTELTHPGGLEFSRQHAEDFARLAALLNCYGIQAPGNRPERVAALKKVAGDDKVVVCCGIGAQGGKLNEAVQAGATFGIVGRAIYQAQDPRAAAMAMTGSLG